MKPNILFFFAIVFFFPLFTMAQPISESIDIKLKGILGPSKVSLLKYNGSKIDTVAQENVKDGAAKFHNKIDLSPDFYFLKISSLDGVLPLFIGAENVEVKGDILQWPKSKISGSISQKDYEEYHLLVDSLENIRKELFKKYKSLKDSVSDLAISLQDSLMQNIIEFEKKQLEFVNGHPSSYYSPVVINNAKWTWIKKRAAYEKLSAIVKASKYGIFLAENIAKWKKTSGLREIGDTVPEFSGVSSNGSTIFLGKEIAENKLTLIDFWASWCVPCRQEHPNLVKIYNENKGKGFDILGISLDENEAAWKAAIAKDGLVWQQVSDLKGWASPIAKLYFAGLSFNFIPQNFLVDAKGKILARNLRGDQLSKKVAEVLKGNTL